MVSKELVAASSGPLVLSLLAQGESYGYAIIQNVRALSGGQLEWTEGMLYPVLHRLHRQGLLRARWAAGDNGRKRRYYRLSAKGTRALAKQQEQWRAVHETLERAWEGVPCLN